MVKFSLFAVLALSAAAPTCGYLASLEKATAAAKESSGDAPSNYYFSNGHADSPMRSASSGIKSYLDALVTSPASSTISGSGMTSYLDALPKNPVVGKSGTGMSSYAESLNQAGATAPPPVFAVANAAESSSFQQSDSSSSASGSGIRSYLDSLPTAVSTATRGAGISSYLDALPSSTAVSGTGMQTYTDALSPNWGLSQVASGSKKGFTIGSMSGTFKFSIDANESMMQQLNSSTGHKVVLKGRVESVSDKPPSGETPSGVSTFSIDADAQMMQKIADANGRNVALKGCVDDVSYEPSTRMSAVSVDAETVNKVEAAAAPEDAVASSASVAAPIEGPAIPITPVDEVIITPVEVVNPTKYAKRVHTNTNLIFQWAWGNTWSNARDEL